MNATEYARLCRNNDPVTMGQADDLIKTARAGDIVHINGGFITALCSLADEGVAVYGMCSIIKHEGAYHLRKDDRVTTEDNAYLALTTAAGSTQHWQRAGEPVEMMGS